MQTDKEAFREFASGALLIVTILGLFAFFIVTLGAREKDQPLEEFKVVTTYKGCDVIRYSPRRSSTYSYFLHCPNQ